MAGTRTGDVGQDANVSQVGQQWKPNGIYEHPEEKKYPLGGNKIHVSCNFFSLKAQL